MTDETIFIVDDDPDMRESLAWLLRTVSYRVETYASAAKFLAAYDPQRPGCLLLDVRMHGLSGIELYEQLAEQGNPPPAIVMTAHADVPTAVRALKSGAAEFLEKPFDRQTLLEQIERALARDRARRQHSARHRDLVARMQRLSLKERQVLAMLMDGMVNKQIAARLDVSERAIELRRAKMLKKLGVGSLAEMIRLAAEADLASPASPPGP